MAAPAPPAGVNYMALERAAADRMTAPLNQLRRYLKPTNLRNGKWNEDYFVKRELNREAIRRGKPNAPILEPANAPDELPPDIPNTPQIQNTENAQFEQRAKRKIFNNTQRAYKQYKNQYMQSHRNFSRARNTAIHSRHANYTGRNVSPATISQISKTLANERTERQRATQARWNAIPRAANTAADARTLINARRNVRAETQRLQDAKFTELSESTNAIITTVSHIDYYQLQYISITFIRDNIDTWLAEVQGNHQAIGNFIKDSYNPPNPGAAAQARPGFFSRLLRGAQVVPNDPIKNVKNFLNAFDLVKSFFAGIDPPGTPERTRIIEKIRTLRESIFHPTQVETDAFEQAFNTILTATDQGLAPEWRQESRNMFNLFNNGQTMEESPPIIPIMAFLGQKRLVEIAIEMIVENIPVEIGNARANLQRLQPLHDAIVESMIAQHPKWVQISTAIGGVIRDKITRAKQPAGSLFRRDEGKRLIETAQGLMGPLDKDKNEFALVFYNLNQAAKKTLQDRKNRVEADIMALRGQPDPATPAEVTARARQLKTLYDEESRLRNPQSGLLSNNKVDEHYALDAYMEYKGTLPQDIKNIIEELEHRRKILRGGSRTRKSRRYRKKTTVKRQR